MAVVTEAGFCVGGVTFVMVVLFICGEARMLDGWIDIQYIMEPSSYPSTHSHTFLFEQRES